MKLFAVLLLCTLAVGCGYSHSTTPIQPGTMPLISGLVPPSANSGGPAFTFEVDGTNFAANAVINFNGAAQATTVVSASKLTTMIASTAIANSGTVPVTVTNPGKPGGIYGGGTQAATSTAMNFTVN
jgi:IPT/TIG domain